MAQGLIAAIGGLGPALFWLWFWLREDSAHPEPRAFIIRAFALGGLAVIPTYFIERWLHGFSFFQTGIISCTPGYKLFIATAVWVVVEETLKYLAVHLAALRNAVCDEPIDTMIYLISGALGFAAVENALFISTSFGGGGLVFLLTGSYRFIGATLVHVVASGLLGGFVALGFYRPRRRFFYLGLGLTLASVLHTLFNYLILVKCEKGIFSACLLIWLATIFIIFFFERVKKIARPDSTNYV